VADLPGNVARERLTEALDRLDDVIHEIRDYAFTSGGEGQGGGEDPAPLGTAAWGTRTAGLQGRRFPFGPRAHPERDLTWLQPYPSPFLKGTADTTRIEGPLPGQETIEQAFAAGLQRLPPRQPC
jgi:hypothetical protein